MSNRQNLHIIHISKEYTCLVYSLGDFFFFSNQMNEKRVGVWDKTLCFGIRKEKRKSRVEKRNYFIRLQLAFFIWHLFHYLLFPDDSVMSSLFLLPKHFTEHVLHAYWQSWTIWHSQLLFTWLDISSFSKYTHHHQQNTSSPSHCGITHWRRVDVYNKF